MAHRGKTYPVHFRRDWNLGVTNNSKGFAKGYYVFTPGGFGSLGAALKGKKFTCVTFDELTFSGLKWKSAKQSVGGVQMRCEMTTSIAQGFPIAVATGQIIADGIGVLINFRGPQPVNFNYGSLKLGFDPGDCPNPAYFSAGADRSINANAILWNDWNNL